MTSFNGVLQSSTFDHGEAYNQRQHEERKAKNARIDRAVEWIGARVTGTYSSHDALCYAVCAVAVTFYGRALREDEHEVLEAASRIIFAGLSSVGARITKDQTGRVAAVTLPRAA
jgi:hypothetical protein